jgi:hypothetical protein
MTARYGKKGQTVETVPTVLTPRALVVGTWHNSKNHGLGLKPRARTTVGLYNIWHGHIYNQITAGQLSGYIIYGMVIYTIKRPWVGAKPRPDPPPTVTYFEFKYIRTHIYIKSQPVVRWSDGLCEGAMWRGGPGVEPHGLQYNFT